ncbi:filamentous hemagglutinin N-terminal domain-containing protein [Pantoea sp.]|uniref:two-partner secretion domain-containing protein n=1 Tax=Pantoea sp. TaxID=69393 RepID=UPI002897B9E8|nr:filamentous hemagglutinin N-terminal domain-containing protein [Pantoea sp.]
MNKQCYRVVFNQARGLLMVVAEIAKSQRSVSCPASGVAHISSQRIAKLKRLSFSLLLVLGYVSFPADAGIVADGAAAGNLQPTLTQTANGTPQVNIQTPSAGGVSRNIYSQFDVDQRGVILNNSHSNTQTQIAGMVNGNPHLAKGEASVILNEINARNPSQLNGRIEVAGRNAQVVIANPAGITCNGCGFINANRATLTTGQVQIHNGRITGYDVNNGEIVVQGAGMDSSRQDSTDLIARAVKVNAGIWAKELNITTGRNFTDAAHQTVAAKTPEKGTAPALALDVSALGGMYANKIRLLGTENGVGVRNAGSLGAAAGDVVVNVDGSIGNNGSITASQQLRLTSQGDLDNSGKLDAGMDSVIDAAGLLSNSGIIAAGRNAMLQARSLNSNATGKIVAGINRDGTLGAAGDLSLSSQGELRVNGQATAAGQLTAKGAAIDLSGSQTWGRNLSLEAATGAVTTANATVAAQEHLIASSKVKINNDGGQISADKLTLATPSLSNQKGLFQQLGSDDLKLSFRDDFNNTGGTFASNSANITLDTAQWINLSGAFLHYGTGKAGLTIGRLDSSAGTLFSKGSLALTGDTLLLDNATTQAERIALTARSLSHRQGSLIQTGREEMTLRVSDAFNNQEGNLAANGDISLSVGSLNNQRGVITAAQDSALWVDAQSQIDNRNGTMAAAGSLSLRSAALNNDGGLLQSGQAMTLTLSDGALSNRNSGGKGGILSRGALSITGGEIDNSAGFIAAAGEAALTGLDFINQDGTLASEADLNMQVRGLNNQRGRIQAGAALTVDTQGNSISNLNGLFSAGQTLRLLSGALLNTSGQLLSSDSAFISTLGELLNNFQGVIAAAGDARIESGALNNHEGQLQIVGDAVINAAGAQVDNTAGLIRSGKNLSLTTTELINRQTQGENRGLEAQSVEIHSAAIDNRDGILRASDRLALHNERRLNNQDGLISAGKLIIHGGDTLTLTNTRGTLIAGDALDLTADALSGDGRVLSQQMMTLVLQQAFFNQGEIVANGDMNFTLGQGLVNQALIRAGGVLRLNASALDNQQSGEIGAGENHLNLAGSATNRGLLDGGLTHITAGQILNIGSGRLYGDHIALFSGTLENLAEDGVAATLAARDRLDIGVQTLNNRDHGLIYSGGDLTIGGALDGNLFASGKATVLNNHSATIEAARDMTLNIGEINNINDRLVTEVVEIERSYHHEAALKGSTHRFDWADIDTSYKNKWNVTDAIMPDGTRGNNFYEYQYERTILETRIKESDPGQLIAGGNLTINSDRVNNHDSRILAGGVLGGLIGELNNIATLGKRIITDIGKQIHWYAKKTSDGMGGTKTSQGKKKTKYAPAALHQSVDLQAMAWQGNTQINGSGAQIDGRNTSGATVIIEGIGAITADTEQTPVNPPPGQIVEIVIPGEGNNDSETAIRTVAPNTRLPDNSLFRLHPDNDVPFLIETDPRYTNQRQWLGSDYMQKQFTQDPNNVLKRLGDGYYEQQLIRQQIVSLTGQRFLSGYNNDEAQFRALMDAGVLFGKAHGLIPGVALTAQQMALLTSDMVWLVRQSVTLPDGSTQQVVVPQLYVRVKKGDLDGSGALLGGDNIALNVNNDLTNSGHISGRNVTQLTADNLHNSGFIGGDQLDLRARIDINNVGGALQGGSSLTAIAGRDINSISTLSGSGGNISLNRPAGIYVQNPGGALMLEAFNNVNLTASMVSNAGEGSRTQIVAGNDLNLNTLTVTHSEYGSWGKGNDRTLTQSSEVGSRINGNGDLLLSAGHDLSTRAAEVTAAGSLGVTAGNDIRITSGENRYHLTENSRQKSGGLLSSKSVASHDDVQEQSAVASRFSGDSVAMQAGRDMTLSGSSVAGTQDVLLSAGRDLTLTTAEQFRQENHQYQEKKSGFSGTGGVGGSYGNGHMGITQ